MSDHRLSKPFGRLCVIEMFERLGYTAVRSVVPVYIMQADEPGGLHLTAGAKGTIYAWWFFVQSILPIFVGGFADRYGFRRTLRLALAVIATGFLLMAFARSFGSFLGATIVMAAGTALFKPALQGGIAQILDERSASLGWGIFYWIVNVGALIAPFVATMLLGDPHSLTGWRLVFLFAAGAAVANLLMAFALPRIPSGAVPTETPLQVMIRTLRDIWQPRLVAFLLLMSAFWMMMYQLWDLFPNFINDWTRSGSLADSLSRLPLGIGAHLTEQHAGGLRVPQQVLLAVNPALIVIFVVPLAWLVRRMPTLTAMMIGMGLVTIGMAIAGTTTAASFLLAGILLFSFGEMLIGPKQNEYLGLIAPPGKKGLYLGYANLPFGLGGLVGAKLAGFLYGRYGEKATLSLRYLAEQRTPAANIEIGDAAALEATTGVSRREAFDALQAKLGIGAEEASRLLWETYDPQWWVWMPFVVSGIIASLGLALLMMSGPARSVPVDAPIRSVRRDSSE